MTVGEEFGIADPLKVMAQVNEICATRLDYAKVAIAGDWHGNPGWARHAVEYGVQNNADHFLHVGDFGYWVRATERGSDSWEYLKRVNTVLDKHNRDLWWLDGNHEFHPELQALVAKHGNDRPITLPGWNRIHYLPRGYRWSWWGKQFMAVGGAWSIDRFLRTEGKGWWPQELISDEELAYAKREPQGLDVIFSHDCPKGVDIPGIGPDSKPRGGADIWPPDMLAGAARHRARFREIWDVHHPQRWYHGHYHVPHETWYGPTRFIGLDCDGASGGMAQNVAFLKASDLK